VVEHEFRLRNDGQALLRITRVKPACGCTAATLTKRELQPGEETVLLSRLKLRGRKGSQSKSIQVESNDPVNPRLRLWLKGSVRTELAAEPPRVNFGALPADGTLTKEVKVVSNHADTRILEATCKSPQFKVNVWAPDDARGVGVDISIVPPLQAGYVHGQVTITTDHPKRPTLSIPVYAQVQGEISVVPRELMMSKRLARPVTRAILLRPGVAKDFTVKSVECAAEGAVVEIVREGVECTGLTCAISRRNQNWTGGKSSSQPTGRR